MIDCKWADVLLVGMLLVWGVEGATTGNAGSGSAHENSQPILGLNHIIRLTGQYEELGEIGLFGGNFAPRGWALAEG